MATWTKIFASGGLSGFDGIISFATDLDDNLYVNDENGNVFEYNISGDTETTINTTASMNIDGGIVWFNGNLYMLANQSGSPEVFKWNGTADSRTSVETLPTSDTYWLLEDGVSMLAFPDASGVISRYTTNGTAWSNGTALSVEAAGHTIPGNLDRNGNQIRVSSYISAGSKKLSIWNGTGWTTEKSSSSLNYQDTFSTDKDGLYWDKRASSPIRSSTDFATWTNITLQSGQTYVDYFDVYGSFQNIYGLDTCVDGLCLQVEFCQYNSSTNEFEPIDTAVNVIYQTFALTDNLPLINIPSGATSPGSYMVVTVTSAFNVWKRSTALPEAPAAAVQTYTLTHSAGGIPGAII